MIPRIGSRLLAMHIIKNLFDGKSTLTLRISWQYIIIVDSSIPRFYWCIKLVFHVAAAEQDTPVAKNRTDKDVYLPWREAIVPVSSSLGFLRELEGDPSSSRHELSFSVFKSLEFFNWQHWFLIMYEVVPVGPR